jgi:hypothetical protein
MTGLRDALTDIYRRHEALTPAIVVEEARPTGAPLHDRFEWDDSVAGEKYRQQQAADLIRSVKITMGRDEEGPKTIREWVSVTRPDRPRSYEPLAEVVENDLSLRLVLQEMERDIAALRRKYGHLKEYVDLMRREAQ